MRKLTILAAILAAILVSPAAASAVPTLTINGNSATASGFPTTTTQIEFAVVQPNNTTQYFKLAASGGASTLTLDPNNYPGITSVQVDAHAYRPTVGAWLGRKTLTFVRQQFGTPTSFHLDADGRTLKWDPVYQVSWYKLATSDAPAGQPRTTTYQNIGNVTSFDPPDAPGTTRYYGLQAVKADGTVSGWTSEVSITYPAPPPPPPASLVLGTMQNRSGGGPDYPSTVSQVGSALFREEGSVDRLITITNEARAVGADVLPIVEYNLAASEVQRLVNTVHPKWLEISNEVYFVTDPITYGNGVRAVSQAAKAVDPNIKIIVSMGSPDQGVPQTWADGLRPYAPYFDMLAVHPYRLRSHDAAWAFNHNAVAHALSNFPDKQVAITEVGWPTGGPDTGYTPTVTEAQQATFLQNLIPEINSNFPGKVPLLIIYRFNQAGNTSTIEGYFSIDNKPAESVFANLCTTYCP